MNLNYNKALYLLDLGRYDKGEECILKALSECTNQMEILDIKSCYAELLYELERYDEAMECVNYILENTEDEIGIEERDIALEIKSLIEGED